MTFGERGWHLLKAALEHAAVAAWPSHAAPVRTPIRVRRCVTPPPVGASVHRPCQCSDDHSPLSDLSDPFR